jgi:arsenite-transporting ATPase
MRLIIYTGKGGTGKTVTSCCTAIKLAEKEYRTLVVSSDPAHTLGDAFKLSDHNKQDSIESNKQDSIESSQMRKISPNLHALQVDPIIEIKEQYSDILTYMASIFSSRGVDEPLAYEIAMMPGMTQLFSLLKIEQLIRTKAYDVIVLDMPASGEALRYLYFPKLAGTIGRKLTGLMGAFSGFSKMFQAFSGVSLPNGVFGYEQELFGRLDILSDIIRDNNVTSLRLVANPDSFSIENAKRALMSASLYGINVDLAVVNKIIPASTLGKNSSEYFTKLTEFQQSKLEEARANFYPLPIKEVPLHSVELAGVEMLRSNANLMFGDSDPADIYYQGKPFSIVQQDSNRLQFAVKVPFTTEKDLEITRFGSEVILKIRSATGYIVNVIPLPVITYNMEILEATVNNNVLDIIFEKN